MMGYNAGTAVLSTALMTLLLAAAVQADPQGDLITYLPGLLKQPSFNQYSGYLNGTGTHMLHYWYIESQNSPTKDPLIVWLTGGPGCSSLYALLAENGPFSIQPDGLNLNYNDNSWNKFANLLYIESPAGVGFSYTSDGQLQTDDDQITNDHLAALQYFFTQFPEAAKLPLFLMGEGYGGVYVPLLASKIDQGSSITMLKGFAVGNAMTSEAQLANSLMYFAYYRGIIGEGLWSSLQTSCCTGGVCNFYKSTVPACTDAVDKALHNVDSIGINPYNILDDCAGGAPPPGGARQKDGYIHYGTSATDVFRYSKYVQTKRMLLQKVPSYKLKQDLTCMNTSLVSAYINNGYVREALHISPSLPAWELCSAQVQQNYTKLYPDMTAIYTALQQTYKYHILLYNGDVDAMDNCIGNEWFVDALKLEEEVQWRSWLYDDNSLQVAGFVKEYDRVAFATIKGAGHMSPSDKPVATAQLIYNFVNDRPF